MKYFRELGASIVVCDTQGKIVEMNNKACDVFSKSGGKELIGKNLFDCHPGESKDKLRNLIDNEKTNIYTIEKNGVKKLLYQTPWYENGKFAGVVELAIELPKDMPHFVRE